MNIYAASVRIMPLKALLDPQGKVVTHSLKKINLVAISDVRVGKHITLELQAENEIQAHQLVDEACKKLLCNPIMEFYEFDVKSI